MSAAIEEAYGRAMARLAAAERRATRRVTAERQVPEVRRARVKLAPAAAAARDAEIARLAEEGVALPEIARRVGCSRSWASRILTKLAAVGAVRIAEREGRAARQALLRQAVIDGRARGLSRAQIAREIGLSVSRVGALVTELKAEGRL